MTLSDLVRVLWTGKLTVATPHKLLAAVYSLQPRFAGYEQQDAQDFLYFLLDQTMQELQPELNAGKMAELKQLFGGEFQSTLTCRRCQWTSFSKEPFTGAQPRGAARDRTGRARVLTAVIHA